MRQSIESNKTKKKEKSLVSSGWQKVKMYRLRSTKNVTLFFINFSLCLQKHKHSLLVVEAKPKKKKMSLITNQTINNCTNKSKVFERAFLCRCRFQCSIQILISRYFGGIFSHMLAIFQKQAFQNDIGKQNNNNNKEGNTK